MNCWFCSEPADASPTARLAHHCQRCGKLLNANCPICREMHPMLANGEPPKYCSLKGRSIDDFRRRELEKREERLNWENVVLPEFYKRRSSPEEVARRRWLIFYLPGVIAAMFFVSGLTLIGSEHSTFRVVLGSLAVTLTVFPVSWLVVFVYNCRKQGVAEQKLFAEQGYKILRFEDLNPIFQQ